MAERLSRGETFRGWGNETVADLVATIRARDAEIARLKGEPHRHQTNRPVLVATGKTAHRPAPKRPGDRENYPYRNQRRTIPLARYGG